ncbi:DinB family protein [Kibdelosporangium persicum]|uniref:Type I restriction-modification system methyltransferase subunit n=1 Tax=Kibdelosporangium persicum TaxID=2698649 RepID=A0ABX2F1R4_9PSEU|nr:DinB family protein [Kibdelosporangium persicum]NRN65069.1 Type I restriction-modification system methyltransferase subunit [Kibdelosporangium persicum]
MRTTDEKAHLRRYLQAARDALLWKLDGLGEYDIRRPVTATGTNLLGLVKHVTGCEIGYFGLTFGRPLPIEPYEGELNADMWATEDESRADIVDRYREVWAHSDVTIESLELDSVGRVPHWPAEQAEITLHRALVHMIAETHRHAGHADIVRETIDGAIGLTARTSNLPTDDRAWWAEYRERLDHTARAAADRWET